MYHADNWQLRREDDISKLTLSTLYLRINMYLVQGWLFQEIFFKQINVLEPWESQLAESIMLELKRPYTGPATWRGQCRLEKELPERYTWT